MITLSMNDTNGIFFSYFLVILLAFLGLNSLISCSMSIHSWLKECLKFLQARQGYATFVIQDLCFNDMVGLIPNLWFLALSNFEFNRSDRIECLTSATRGWIRTASFIYSLHPLITERSRTASFIYTPSAISLYFVYLFLL